MRNFTGFLTRSRINIIFLRKPEPYKGKGIRFFGEEIKKKAGKSASSQ